jgi:two-component system, LuxR family, sensor kinase FixL
MIRWHVSDIGSGLADDVRESLFEPMTSTKANGMGNGPLISKSLLEADYARIWAGPHTGATFSFALPLTAAEIEE